MSLNVSLPPEVESWLKQEAAREGTTPEQMVVRAVQTQFATASAASTSPIAARPSAPRLSPRETELFTVINDGFPEEFWGRYKELRARLHAEAMTEAEQQEFLALNDQVEEKNARRIGALGELAQLRGTTLRGIMEKLGIGPVQVPE